MKYSKEKQCIVNDDGSLMKFDWPKGKTPSIVYWSDKKYQKYLTDGLLDANDGKPIINNLIGGE